MNADESRLASDEELVRRFQAAPDSPAGRSAAEELFERYRRPVYLWCLRRVKDHETALDLAQDALISAYRGLGSFQGRARYASWLFTIMRHRCFRALRPVPLWRDDDVETDTLAGSGVPVDLDLERKEDEENLLRTMVEVLSREERVTLWLRCVERLPIDQINRTMGFSTASGARSVLQSARRKLHRALEGKERGTRGT